jgi:hypothetical protein
MIPQIAKALKERPDTFEEFHHSFEDLYLHDTELDLFFVIKKRIIDDRSRSIKGNIAGRLSHYYGIYKQITKLRPPAPYIIQKNNPHDDRTYIDFELMLKFSWFQSIRFRRHYLKWKSNQKKKKASTNKKELLEKLDN